MSRQESADPGRERRERVADWTSLSISAIIVLLLVALVGYQYVSRGYQPAIIEVEPRLEAVRKAGGVYYLPVEVTNQGGRTVETVKVSLSLQTASGEESSDFQLDFLAGGATEVGAVVFNEDPTQNRLTVGPVSYVRP